MLYRYLQKLIYLDPSYLDPFQPAQKSLPQLFFAIGHPLSIPDNPKDHNILSLLLSGRSRLFKHNIFLKLNELSVPSIDSSSASSSIGDPGWLGIHHGSSWFSYHWNANLYLVQYPVLFVALSISAVQGVNVWRAKCGEIHTPIVDHLKVTQNSVTVFAEIVWK